MSVLNARLVYLFNTYYNGTASQQEKDELFHIIQSSASDAELTELIHQAWDTLEADTELFDHSKSEEMLNHIIQTAGEDERKDKPAHIYPLWRQLGIAAAMLIFASFGAYVFLGHKKEADLKKTLAKARPAPDVLPGGNKAVLTLANGKTIILDSAQNGMLAKQGTTSVNKTRDGQLVYESGENANGKDAAINTVSTPNGGQYQLVLPDGSKVWLNAASSLSFPTIFTGKTRDVSITGEAYFEVAKNKAMPFRVKVKNAVVEVLGTHFNVMAYDNEATLKTTLLEGAVKISNGKSWGMLKPNQQAILSANGDLKVNDDEDAADEIAWKNGLFQFNDAGIEIIMRQAARWYDVDIAYQGKIPVKQYTGRISRNVKASELLSMLSYTGVNFKIEGRKIIVMP